MKRDCARRAKSSFNFFSFSEYWKWTKKYLVFTSYQRKQIILREVIKISRFEVEKKSLILNLNVLLRFLSFQSFLNSVLKESIDSKHVSH